MSTTSFVIAHATGGYQFNDRTTSRGKTYIIAAAEEGKLKVQGEKLTKASRAQLKEMGNRTTLNLENVSGVVATSVGQRIIKITFRTEGSGKNGGANAKTTVYVNGKVTGEALAASLKKQRANSRKSYEKRSAREGITKDPRKPGYTSQAASQGHRNAEIEAFKVLGVPFATKIQAQQGTATYPSGNRKGYTVEANQAKLPIYARTPQTLVGQKNPTRQTAKGAGGELSSESVNRRGIAQSGIPRRGK